MKEKQNNENKNFIALEIRYISETQPWKVIQVFTVAGNAAEASIILIL